MGFLLPQYCTAFHGLLLYIKGTCVDGDFQLFRASLTSKMPLLWCPVVQLDTWLGQIIAVRFQIWSITHLVQKDCQGEVWVTQCGTDLSKESATLEVVACFLGQGVTVICTVVRCVLHAAWGQRVTISCLPVVLFSTVCVCASLHCLHSELNDLSMLSTIHSFHWR